MKRLIILTAIFLCPIFAFTAQAQTIRGRIVDIVSNEPIPEVTVEGVLVCGGNSCAGSTHKNTTRTAADGSFEITIPPSPGGACCLIPGRYYQFSKDGYNFSAPGNAGLFGTTTDAGTFYGTNRPLLSLSAASFKGERLAIGSIATIMGEELATVTASADTIPLPTVLGQRSLTVKNDFIGVEKAAQLFYVSPTQINFLIPEELVNAPATIRLYADNKVIRGGFISLLGVWPGVFSANMNSEGVAAAVVLRIKADGSSRYEPVAQFDSAQNRFVATPIDLGSDSDQLFLILFGTGWRFRGALRNMRCEVGGINADVLYAGPQGFFAGLDQANVRLPRSLMGRGDVTMTVDGAIANSVSVNIK